VNCHQQQLQPANKRDRLSAEEGLVTRLKYTVIKGMFHSIDVLSLLLHKKSRKIKVPIQAKLE
jgi:hypothetical protein